MRRRWKSGATYIAAALMMAAAAAGMTGCASSTAPSITSDAPSITSGAPPTVICGTVLSDSAAGAVVDDATRTLPTIMYETVGGVLFFGVAPGCDKGVSVRWTPSSAARLVKAAYARDGGIAAVVLEPNGSSEAFRLAGTRNGRVVASAIVKLAS